MGEFRFELIGSSSTSRARLGRLTTPRGIVHTPAFMPVGTQGTVKTLTSEEVHELGAEIILANTFHLFFRPGADLIAKLGGLHRFMHWDGPILTDSGGYQVFSLAKHRTLADEGVAFRSPLDGSDHTFTPEGVLQVQQLLGSDVVMPLDVCLGYPADDAQAREALRLTVHWAQRSKAVGTGEGQMLFGIIQGGFTPALRKEATVRMCELGFAGYALGGLSVGEPRELTYTLIDEVATRLPIAPPRYLMGVGAPPSLLDAIALGVDMFDCALPTRVARTGTVFTRRGRMNVRNGAYREDQGPLDEACRCPVCAHYSRAYIRHLFNADEILGPRLATYHNLFFLARLMDEAREAIAADRFETWRAGVGHAYATPW